MCSFSYIGFQRQGGAEGDRQQHAKGTIRYPSSPDPLWDLVSGPFLDPLALETSAGEYATAQKEQHATPSPGPLWDPVWGSFLDRFGVGNQLGGNGTLAKEGIPTHPTPDPLWDIVFGPSLDHFGAGNQSGRMKSLATVTARGFPFQTHRGTLFGDTFWTPSALETSAGEGKGNI